MRNTGRIGGQVGLHTYSQLNKRPSSESPLTTFQPSIEGGISSIQQEMPVNSLINTIQADSISDFSKDNVSRGINISVGGQYFENQTLRHKDHQSLQPKPKLNIQNLTGQVTNKNDIMSSFRQPTVPERRAISLVRGSVNATDLLANTSFMQSNASTSNILDSQKDIK